MLEAELSPLPLVETLAPSRHEETMNPDLEKLVILQRLDLELKRLREENESLPRHVAGLAARSAAAQGTLIAVEESLAKEEKLRRSLESDIKDQTARGDRLRRQMDVVTTSAQANALEHEISFAKAEVGRLEDLELESMERTEAKELERTRARGDAEAAETTLERERLRAADRISGNQGKITELSGERAALRPTVGERTLATYDRIAKAKGTGIAEGVDGKCSACQMVVRPQKWNDLRDRSDNDTIMTCESCGRLLYWDPARDAPVKKSVQGVAEAPANGKAEVR